MKHARDDVAAYECDVAMAHGKEFAGGTVAHGLPVGGNDWGRQIAFIWSVEGIAEHDCGDVGGLKLFELLDAGFADED